MKQPMKPQDQPLVSIIISSYNYRAYLRQAIDSALQQTYPHVEVIVVDDESLDDSPEIIHSYGQQVKSILKKNGGQASALNAGFRQSKGSIILFLDSDDVLLPEALEHACQSFSDSTVVKTHWTLEEIDAYGTPQNKRLNKFPLATGDLTKDLIQHGPSKSGGPPYGSPTSGNAWSRNLLEQIMPIPEKLYKSSPDQYLNVLAPVYGELRSIEKTLGYYRMHGNNYSARPVQQYASEYIDRYEHSRAFLKQHLQKRGIKVNASKWQRNSWFHQIWSGINDILKLVPNKAGFVLVDDNAWGIDQNLAHRRRFHLVDHHGKYYGPPSNDDQAIFEIERERKEGAGYIFFTSNSFWWLDYYTKLADHLKRNYPCILSNERLLGFQLQTS